MLNGYYLAKETAAMLTEKAGRPVTIDDLRQMRRRKHIEGMPLAYNLVVYTQEQIEAATIPPERQPSKKRQSRTSKVKRKRTRQGAT